MEAPPHATAPAIVRRVRAWPRRWHLGLMAALTLAALLAVLALPPFPQPRAYHNFADQRGLFGVPHFLNVASNAVFVLVGAGGLWFVLAAPGRPKRPAPPRGGSERSEPGGRHQARQVAGRRHRRSVVAANAVTAS